jgi:hypothetical protein
MISTESRLSTDVDNKYLETFHLSYLSHVEVIHVCEWCRKQFSSKRPHSRFCSSRCRLQAHRIHKNFKRIEELLPEDQVKEKYYTSQPNPCVIYLQWFRQKEGKGHKIFADVYVSNECSPALVAKMRRMKNKFPARTNYTGNVSLEPVHDR